MTTIFTEHGQEVIEDAMDDLVQTKCAECGVDLLKHPHEDKVACDDHSHS